MRRESRQNYTRAVGGRSEGKMLYDLYEPEANCLSEERFGNDRFASFGDGPKFVCGSRGEMDAIVESAFDVVADIAGRGPMAGASVLEM